MATRGEYWNGKCYRPIEERMVLTTHFGKTNLHPISECNDKRPSDNIEVDYCPCCGREL